MLKNEYKIESDFDLKFKRNLIGLLKMILEERDYCI